MELKVNRRTIVIEDGEDSFEVSQAVDDDIWFMSKKPNITSIIDYRSRNHSECRTAEVFGSLLREIIGHSILEEDLKDSCIPKDFIDLDNKIITWYSNSGTNNILEIQYSKECIIVSLTKDPNISEHSNNGVRIRTNGSNYGTYYHYFLKFYRELLQLAYQLNPPQIDTIQATQDQPITLQKKRKWFNKR